MRRACLAIVVVLACKSGGESEPAADDTNDTKDTKDTKAPADETKEPDGGGSSSGASKPAPTPIAIDDANRFVKDDLDRFLAQYPAALRKQDSELFRTCLGARCLEHGVSKTVTPFSGPGVRYLVPLWLRGCMSGSAESCMYAGRTYQSSAISSSGEPVHEGWEREDLAKRFRMYIDRACTLDETECEQWADFMLGDDASAPDDVELAIQRLEDGCARKEHGSCAALARHASDHPAIGDEIAWWRKACEHDPNTPSRECARLAERLLLRGNKGDREQAIAALGGTCDPTRESWSRECTGDPKTGEEACAHTYVHSHGHPCILLAPSLPEEDALRISAAMCVGSLLDETNALARQACTHAAKLAESLERPAGYRSAIARRACEVDHKTCLSETHELLACADAREVCKAAAG